MKILNRNMHLGYRSLPVNIYESTKLSLGSEKLYYNINTIQYTDINIKYKDPLMLHVKQTNTSNIRISFTFNGTRKKEIYHF